MKYKNKNTKSQNAYASKEMRAIHASYQAKREQKRREKHKKLISRELRQLEIMQFFNVVTLIFSVTSFIDLGTNDMMSMWAYSIIVNGSSYFIQFGIVYCMMGECIKNLWFYDESSGNTKFHESKLALNKLANKFNDVKKELNFNVVYMIKTSRSVTHDNNENPLIAHSDGNSSGSEMKQDNSQNSNNSHNFNTNTNQSNSTGEIACNCICK